MTHRLQILFALILALFVGVPASAQERNEQYTLKEHEAKTGSKFRSTAVRSENIPINLPYDELTEKQKKILKAPYESMGENDEPPFPERGLASIFKEVHDAQKILFVRGNLRLHASINAEGKATSVSVIESVDSRMDVYVAGILMRAKFKPARCNGVPCAQAYLFAMAFSWEY